MGKLTAKQVIAYSKADPKKYSDGEGLYFCVRKQGSPYWMIRYFEERRIAHQTVPDTIEPLVNFEHPSQHQMGGR